MPLNRRVRLERGERYVQRRIRQLKGLNLYVIGPLCDVYRAQGMSDSTFEALCQAMWLKRYVPWSVAVNLDPPSPAALEWRERRRAQQRSYRAALAQQRRTA